MENKYTISEAKNRLPAIVHAVENGPSVKLTRRGRPVAVLLSIEEYERLSRKQNIGFWDALMALREYADGIEISNDDFANLRDRSTGRMVDPF
jgi:antitoxin Phd